jgi:hypothetical protein
LYPPETAQDNSNLTSQPKSMSGRKGEAALMEEYSMRHIRVLICHIDDHISDQR